MNLDALIFMPALVGAVVLGFAFLLFLCNYYLTVLEGTAAGAKEIPWVSGSVTEHFPKLWYLGFLIGVWLMPAIVIGRIATAGMHSPWVSLIGPLLVLWVCYPISQLSSLSASTPWLPLVPDVFARLAQKPLVVLQFLILSAAVFAVFAVSFRWTFQLEGNWELLFVGAPLLVFTVFLYARLLGRLAFVLRFTKGLFPTKRKKKPKAESEREEKAADTPKPKQKRRQPRDLPPLDSPEGELAGYDVKFEDEAPPGSEKPAKAEAARKEPEAGAEGGAEWEGESRPPRRARRSPTGERSREWTEEDEDAAAYGVREAEVTPEERIPEEVVKPKEAEMQLLDRSDAPKKPRRAWGPDLLVFLGQPGTISAILIASAFCFGAGTMIRVARAFNPAAGGGD